MKLFKNIRFNYYWAKGEKAFKNGDEKTANVCKKETQRNQITNKGSAYKIRWVFYFLHHQKLKNKGARL